MSPFKPHVVIPHADDNIDVWRPLPEWLGGEQPYDLNSWQESETALALADTLDEDAVIVEGYAEYATWRPHLAYLRDPYGDPDMEMEIDGVGGVSILAKARVFRSGVHFPAFSFEKHAETEGFGKMSRRMDYSVVGLPHYTIWHLYEPSVDDVKRMEVCLALPTTKRTDRTMTANPFSRKWRQRRRPQRKKRGRRKSETPRSRRSSASVMRRPSGKRIRRLSPRTRKDRRLILPKSHGSLRSPPTRSRKSRMAVTHERPLWRQLQIDFCCIHSKPHRFPFSQWGPGLDALSLCPGRLSTRIVTTGSAGSAESGKRLERRYLWALGHCFGRQKGILIFTCCKVDGRASLWTHHQGVMMVHCTSEWTCLLPGLHYKRKLMTASCLYTDARLSVWAMFQALLLPAAFQP